MLTVCQIKPIDRPLNNGKGFFSKISKPTERNGAYQLQFDFPNDERLETGKFIPNIKEISAVPFRTKKEDYLWR